MKGDPEQPFREKLEVLSEKIRDFNEYHLNPASLLITRFFENDNSEDEAKLAQIAVSIAKRQEAGVFLSADLAGEYDLPVWTDDE